MVLETISWYQWQGYIEENLNLFHRWHRLVLTICCFANLNPSIYHINCRLVVLVPAIAFAAYDKYIWLLRHPNPSPAA